MTETDPLVQKPPSVLARVGAQEMCVMGGFRQDHRRLQEKGYFPSSKEDGGCAERRRLRNCSFPCHCFQGV